MAPPPLYEGGRMSLAIEGVNEVELEELLGIGGFGQVWRVRDMVTATPYAMKVFQNLKTGSIETERIRMEAEVIIESPFVVPVVGFSEWDRHTFVILFEFCKARDLAACIEAGDLSPAARRRIFLQVLDAVVAAHRHNIVHRDLKPENILVCEDGVARVIDFGIAKFKDKAVTNTGDCFGTPPYMAPEILIHGSRHADARADIYALGQILYTMAMGQDFWTVMGWRSLDGLIEFLRQDPPPDEIIDFTGFTCDFFDDIEPVLRMMVKRTPEDRYERVEELLDVLGPLEEEAAPTPEPMPEASPLRLDEHPLLVVESGTNKGAITMLPLSDGGERVMGRYDLAGANGSLSRRHVAFSKNGDRYLVQDVGSKHGTLLRGNSLISEARPSVIHPGDRIMMGDIYLRFTYASDL